MTGQQAVAFLVMPGVAYLVGAVPFSYLIGRALGVDIHTKGSGNIGATNLGRVLGRKWGFLGFALDVVKGLVPTAYAGWHLVGSCQVEQRHELPQWAQLAWLLVGAAAIVGHMYPVYLRFRGGKGVATSLGVVVGIYPFFTLTGAFALAVWVGVWGMTRYVSLASITAAVAFPVGFALLIYRITVWQFASLWPMFAFACLMGGMIVFRHRSNVARLRAGTENRTAGLKGAKTEEK